MGSLLLSIHIIKFLLYASSKVGALGSVWRFMSLQESGFMEIWLCDLLVFSI